MAGKDFVMCDCPGVIAVGAGIDIEVHKSASCKCHEPAKSTKTNFIEFCVSLSQDVQRESSVFSRGTMLVAPHNTAKTELNLKVNDY